MNETIYRHPASPYFGEAFPVEEAEVYNRIDQYQWTNDPHEASIFISNTHTPFIDIFNNIKSDKLKLIIHPNSGFDNIPYQLVQDLNVPIILGNSIRALPVASYILMTFFSSLSDSPWKSEWDKKRIWNRSLPSGKEVLVIGAGHIGKIVTRSLESLLGSAICVDPFLGLNPKFEWCKIKVVILACSLNKSSRNIIGHEVLKQLPDDAVIINPARGELIDFNALKNKLESSPNFKAYIDVFPEEPFALETLPYKNLFKSCHIAGVHTQLAKNSIEFVSSILHDYKQMPKNDFEASYKKWDLRFRSPLDFI